MKIAAAQPGERVVVTGRATAARPLRYALLLTITATLAIGLRVLFWWMQSRSGAVQPGDSQEYVQGALHLLLRGNFVTGPKWLRPPLYPAFLATTFALVGIDLSRAMLVQAIVTGLGALLFGSLGYTLFGRRDVAIVSALIAALFVPFAAYGSVLFAEALFIVLLAALFALALRSDQLPHAIGAGVLLGLATLTRAVGLFFLPLTIVGIVADRWLRREIDDRRWLRAGLRHGVIVVLAATLTIAPWTIRNAVAYGRFVAVDTNGGISFWYGTVFDDNELAQGEARLAAIPNLADKQRAALQMAFGDIARDPARYLSRVRFKIVSLWQLNSRNYAAGGITGFDPDGYSLGLTPGELPLPLSLLGDAQYVLLVLGGIWGFCLADRRQRSALLVLWVAFGTLMSGLTIGHPRLRLPLLVAFVPYAAWLLLHLRSLPLLIRRRWRVAAVAALGSLIFVALIYTQQYGRWTRAQLAVWRGDRSDPATYRRAYDLNPANPLWLMAAADRAAARGDWSQAEALYAKAVDQEPRSLYAQVRLIDAALRRNDPAAANLRLATIRGLDRDNNDLLRWAWARSGITPPATIRPVDARALGNIEGFVPAQPNADERWTMATAQLRLQPTSACSTLTLTIRGYRNDQPVQVEVGGRASEIRVNSTQSVYDIPLEAGLCEPNQPLIVTLRTPTRVLDIDAQPWPVGVAVAEARTK